MDKKEIQAKRMKKYFIDATKEVVKKEGPGEITVKKIADIAGYAPATLYNYFEDLNELMFYAGVDFFADSKDYVLNRVDGVEGLKEKIIISSKAYGRFFIENPNAFTLVFLQDIKMPEEWREAGYVPDVAKLTTDYLVSYAKEGFIDEGSIETVLGLLSNSIHGTLLFYIKERGGGVTAEQIIDKIEQEARYVLEK